MACFPRADRRGGYATAAAVVVATGLGVLATAITAAALGDLRAEQAWSARDRDQRRMDSAQAAAIHALMLQGGSSRLQWRTELNGVEVETLAEQEGAKRALSSIAEGDGPPNGLQIDDPVAWGRAIRKAATSPGGLFALSSADTSVQWRSCGLSLLSPYGTARTWPDRPAPESSRPIAFNRRAGQVWRIRTLLPSGLAEDRVVRFTGRTDPIAHVIERRRQVGQTPGDPCAALAKPA